MLKISELETKLEEIIERKHQELNLGRDYNLKFSKIRDFEGNAIGQIGEEFAKAIISEFIEIIDDGVIHNEYDVKTQSGILFEVKTARKGRSNNSFQFNGINPRYNYDYLLCIGICEDAIVFRIFEKKDVSYHHKDRKFYIKQDEFEKQLVQMNPDNQVNYKLTLNIKDFHNISLLSNQLQTILQ
ncbi:MAG: restriction endonuclease [Ignavibacteria bacterium]|jgi:hypothetical protein|nr:restriction endonuclease [Ignavibacteria bacterium]